MNKTKWLSVVLLTFWASAVMAGFIPADDKNLQYTGRIDFSDKKAPLISWAGPCVRANFTGTSLKVKMDDKGNKHVFGVIIDGNYDAVKVIACNEGEGVYDVVSGLEDKTHEVLIHKRTDGGANPTAFLGFELDDGASLKDPPPRPGLRMEVYGDSISTGLGCDRKRGGEHSKEATDNVFAYGSRTARNINAELHCISKSGIGLVKSWWPTIMPQYYDRLSACSLEGSGDAWDFSKWTADLVVINLFQNDSWTIKGAKKDEIIGKYKDFVKKIRGHYPKAKIVCTLGSMSANKNQWAQWVKEAAKQLNDEGDKEVYSYIFKIGTGNRHPNNGDHAKMATELTSFIMTLGMDITLTTPMPEMVTEVASNFTPDPEKKYYIDFPDMGLRLAGGGEQVSQHGYTVTTLKGVKSSETGANVEWVFVANGDKWHIQLAEGGGECRLWTANLPKANGLALTDTSKAGGWTQFKITGASNGKTFLTAPAGPEKFKRLSIGEGGKAGMVNDDNTESQCQLVITEVK